MSSQPRINDIWVSGDQFESETFHLDASLIGDEYIKFVGDWFRVSRQLSQLASLDDDWDGDGASPLDGAIIESVSNWFDSLRRSESKAPTRIVADPDGAVVVEWLEADNYFEVEFSMPYKGEWMSRHADEAAQHGEFNIQPQSTFAEYTVSGAESHPIRGSINDTTWSSTEYRDVYVANA